MDAIQPRLARRRPGEREGTDGRAVVITAAAHVALLLALLASPVGEPLRRGAEMVLVHLDGEPTVAGLPSASAPGVASAPTARRGAAAAPTTARRARPARSEPVVVAEGRDARGASGTAALAAPVAGSAPAGAAGADDRGLGARAGAPKFRPPRVVARVLPAYPQDAAQAGLQGSVNVLVTVAADGRVTDSRVGTSSGVASLDAAAVDGVRAWTFKPAEKYGRPVEAQAIVAIDWKYRPGMTFGPMAVENRRLLQKDFSIANQVRAPGANLDASPAKAAALSAQPCDEARGGGDARYDALALGSSITTDAARPCRSDARGQR